MAKLLNTLFVVGVILAGTFVGPTSASTPSGDRRMRTMQDTATKETIVSVHQDVKSKFDLEDVVGTVDAMLHWNQGVAGNIIWDHEDGSHCVVNSDPSGMMATFSSGHKLVSFTYSEDGYSFFLKDDQILDDNGEMVAHYLSSPLLLAAMQAKSKGLVDRDIATLLDCTQDYFTIWEPADDSRFPGSTFGGLRICIAPPPLFVGLDPTPKIEECAISDIAGLGMSIVGSLVRVGVPATQTCYTSGIAPVIDLFSGSFISIASRIVGAVGNLVSACRGVSTLIDRVVRQIQDSCLFDDRRRLELSELTGGLSLN